MQTPTRAFLNKFGINGCLKLTRLLYGSNVVPNNWYTYLCKALLKLGLKECLFNKCTLYGPRLLMMLYVDNVGIGAPTRKNVEDFVKEWRQDSI